MKRIATSVLASVVLLCACGSDKGTTPAASSTQPAAKPAAKPAENPPPAPVSNTKPAAEPPKPAAESPKPAAEGPKPAASVDMDQAFKDLMAKPEQADESIVIQHILISFAGAPRMRGVTRTKDEAKVLAQKVFDEALAGGDFDALVKQYTNDSAPGTYPLTKAGRAGMVKGFGDVGFRLKVGEIGVSTWDAAGSPFGWHIIKRLK